MDKPKIVFISGLSGTGKSTLVNYFMENPIDTTNKSVKQTANEIKKWLITCRSSFNNATI